MNEMLCKGYVATVSHGQSNVYILIGQFELLASVWGYVATVSHCQRYVYILIGQFELLASVCRVC